MTKGVSMKPFVRSCALLGSLATLLALSSDARATAAVEPSGTPLGPKNRIARQGALISAQTLASTRSFTLEQLADRGSYGLLVLHICTTDTDNSVSLITMTCTASDDDNTTDYTLQDVTVTTGVCASVDASWTKNPGANTTCWPWRVDIEGFEDVECSFANTGGTAADTITVRASLAVKG
jgi:hypothetical protein